MPLVLDGTNGVSGVDGTASNPAIEGTDSNTGIFYPAADTVAIGTGGTERLRVDSAGNAGLAVTPSAWRSTSRAIQFGSGGFVEGRTDNAAVAEVGANGYLDSTGTWRYLGTGTASLYTQAGGHYWYNATSGTAGNAITFTQAMTLDANGKFLVGTTTSPNQQAVIYRTSSNTGNGALLLDGNGSYAGLQFALSGTLRGSISSDTPDLYITHAGNINFRTGSGDHVGGTTRATITGGGYLKVSNNGTYINIGGNYNEINQSANTVGLITFCTDGSFTSRVHDAYANRSANSAYSFFHAYSNYTTAGDLEFNLRGDGNGYADGTWNNNGADYAEFFESATGAALTLGATVVLDGNKVREAADQDPASAIMGVVRPKEPSKASMVVGNTAWNKWANKYLTDDFDRYIMEDHDVLEWTDEDGKQHSYESHNIPAGVTVPDDAVVKTHDDKGNKFQHYKLNPAWNPDAEYVNRENRPEWIIVGLVGQVKILKGQPVNDRWIKMRDVSATVEEWMIR